MRVRGVTARIIGALCALALLAGCGDSPTESSRERYTLKTVSGVSLPAPDPTTGVVDITAGALELRADGTLTEEMTVRCRSSLPAGTTCQVTNGGRSSRVGTYSRAEGWVRFGDREVPAAFTSRSVTITYVCPPSQGFSCPQLVVRYER